MQPRLQTDASPNRSAPPRARADDGGPPARPRGRDELATRARLRQARAPRPGSPSSPPAARRAVAEAGSRARSATTAGSAPATRRARLSDRHGPARLERTRRFRRAGRPARPRRWPARPRSPRGAGALTTARTKTRWAQRDRDHSAAIGARPPLPKTDDRRGRAEIEASRAPRDQLADVRGSRPGPEHRSTPRQLIERATGGRRGARPRTHARALA